MPTILLAAVGTGQHPAGPLHGETPVMKQLAHVPRMVDDAELFFNHPGNHRRSPDPGVPPISYGAAIEDVTEAAMLCLAQARGPSGSITFKKARDAVRLIPSRPLGHLGPRCLQNSCQIAAGPAFGIQDHRLQAFRHAVRTILLRLLAQSDQPAIGQGMQPQQSRTHGYSSCEKYAIQGPIMSL
jgi:hypothetical protein